MAECGKFPEGSGIRMLCSLCKTQEDERGVENDYEWRPLVKDALCNQCRKLISEGYEVKERKLSCPKEVAEEERKPESIAGASPRKESARAATEPYECPECNKRFKKQQHLKRHKESHGKQRYKCEKCLNTYKNKCSLKRHAMEHDGYKIYCSECGKGFTCESMLTLHMRHHTNEKPFVCEDCSAGFPKRYNLHRHRHSKSNVGPFTCQRCGVEFIRRCAYVKHDCS